MDVHDTGGPASLSGAEVAGLTKQVAGPVLGRLLRCLTICDILRSEDFAELPI
jgi:hypothetical protein